MQETDARRHELGRTARVSNIIGILPGEKPDAIGLVAHYDSSADAPGATDDGLGVAVTLEAARVLSAGARRQWTLMALLTDGEEAGLMGAAGLVTDREVMNRLRAYLNIESIGSSGTAVLFETVAEAKDAAHMDELVDVRRKEGGAGAELFLWEAEAHWLAKRYAEVVRVLEAKGAEILDLDSVDSWRVPDRLVRSLVRLGRGADALARARAFGDAFLELLALAAIGEAEPVEAAFEQCLEAGFEAADLYADGDLGPLLRGPKLEALRKKHPE